MIKLIPSTLITLLIIPVTSDVLNIYPYFTPFNKQRNKIEMLHNYNFIRFSLKALLTTLTELKAIAAPAIQGK